MTLGFGESVRSRNCPRTPTPADNPRGGRVMNTYLQECLVRERLDEARALAAEWAAVRSLRPVRRPMRVLVGLALIRAGRWLAHRTPKRTASPGRMPARA